MITIKLTCASFWALSSPSGYIVIVSGSETIRQQSSSFSHRGHCFFVIALLTAMTYLEWLLKISPHRQ